MHKTRKRIKDEEDGKIPVSQLGPPRLQKPMNLRKGTCWTEVITDPSKHCKGRLF